MTSKRISFLPARATAVLDMSRDCLNGWALHLTICRDELTANRPTRVIICVAILTPSEST